MKSLRKIHDEICRTTLSRELTRAGLEQKKPALIELAIRMLMPE